MSARTSVTCPFCNQSITQRKNLQSHINRKHNQEHLEQKTLKKEQKHSLIRLKFKCADCNLTFSRNYNLQRHILSHQKNSDTKVNETTQILVEWYQQPIDIDFINDFIETDLVEFIAQKDKSEYSLNTKKFHKQDIKYVNKWDDLEALIVFAFENANNWQTFLENFKITITHIDNKLYEKLHDNLSENTMYNNLIPLFSQIKVWLQSIRSGTFNHQQINKIVEKMNKF